MTPATDRATGRAGRLLRLGPWLRFGSLGLIAATTPLWGQSQAVAAADAAVWIVDPKVPGPDLPPAGRSLFDHLFLADAEGGWRYRLPFPFTALLQSLRQRLEPGAQALRAVLIPLGRSLQRSAAAPEYFRFPRVVVAVTGMPRGAGEPLLKDRLYLGYQEKAGVLEIISYNEVAGRFEFQVVSGYRAGAAPRVSYARRAVCTACHQNAAPIFARPLWDETNANAGVARRLSVVAGAIHGVPARTGIEVPYAIDAATDRANLLAATQLLWRDGCGGDDRGAITCRAAGLQLALEYALGGAQAVDESGGRFSQALAPILDRQWRQRWPGGLKVPNPDVPNRIPVAADANPSTVVVDVAAAFEPLLPRPPLDVWQADGRSGAKLVTGLSDFFADADVRGLDQHLRRQPATRSRHVADCLVTVRREPASRQRIAFRCGAGPSSARWAGRLYAQGSRLSHGDIDRFALAGEHDAVGLAVAGGTLRNEGRAWRAVLQVGRGRSAARTSRGRTIEAIELGWSDDGAAQATAVIREDVAELARAVERLEARTAAGGSDAFLARPFQRGRVLRAVFDELGVPASGWCCLEDRGMPAPIVDEAAPTASGVALAEPVRDFLRYCGACHRSPDAFPPNYLHGEAAEIEARLAQCAPRILFRLRMWRVAPADRAKTPMPPVHALPLLGLDEVGWRDSGELARLEAHAARLAGGAPGADGRYEALPPCLAPATRAAGR